MASAEDRNDETKYELCYNNFFSISICINSEQKDIFNFIDNNFLWIKKSGDGPHDFHIRLVVKQVEKITQPSEHDKNTMKIGSNLFFNCKKIVFLHQDWLSASYEFIDDKLLEVCIFYKQIYFSPVIKFARKIYSKPDSCIINRERLLFLCRMGLHFPVFFILETFKNAGLLHASAVAKTNKALVLTGFDGVGKSTLAIYLCQQYGYEIISDNFLLYTPEAYILPFLENTRLSNASVDRLGIKAGKEIYGRYEVNIGTYVADPVPVPAQAIAFNYFANDNILESIPSGHMVKYLLAINNYAPEFIDYNKFSAILGLVTRGGKTNLREKLSDFLKHLEIFSLGKKGLEDIDSQASLLILHPGG